MGGIGPALSPGSSGSEVEDSGPERRMRPWSSLEAGYSETKSLFPHNATSSDGKDRLQTTVRHFSGFQAVTLGREKGKVQRWKELWSGRGEDKIMKGTCFSGRN